MAYTEKFQQLADAARARVIGASPQRGRFADGRRRRCARHPGRGRTRRRPYTRLLACQSRQAGDERRGGDPGSRHHHPLLLQRLQPGRAVGRYIAGDGLPRRQIHCRRLEGLSRAGMNRCLPDPLDRVKRPSECHGQFSVEDGDSPVWPTDLLVLQGYTPRQLVRRRPGGRYATSWAIRLARNGRTQSQAR